MTKNAKADRTLDCLGLFCPEPVFRTRLELDKMKPGETLEIFADDPAAEKDIESLSKRLGHDILEMRKKGNTIYFLIKKKENKRFLR
ncbi:MAG: sulfurtransferase TusA family protein [Candidatus Bathyarchaeota archaeon]|nr:MAG: sulfurtransferase TusA family protein [Candidatus Bathyarchaeota archaeon]